MDDPIEDIAFLARSPNRVRVLAALADERGSRQELGERTHVSRVTLGRVLSDFESRGWAAQENGTFCITPLGKLVADAFSQLRDTVEAAANMRSVSDWYPDGGFGFEFELLTDASFSTPNQQDPLAPVRTAVDHIEHAETIRLMTNATAPENLGALRDGVVDRGLELELVAAASVLETIAADPDMTAQLREILAAGTPVYRTEANLPYIVSIHDDTVDIGLDDDRGVPAVLIESDHPEVYAWAEDRFERYRSNATPVDESSFDRR